MEQFVQEIINIKHFKKYINIKFNMIKHGKMTLNCIQRFIKTFFHKIVFLNPCAQELANIIQLSHYTRENMENHSKLMLGHLL